MEINKINLFTRKDSFFSNRIQKKYNNNNPIKGEEVAKQQVFAHNLNFKSHSAMTLALANEYKNLVYNKHVLPIDAFLKIKAPKEALEKLLCNILTENDTSYNFIDSIVSNPRQNKHYNEALAEILPEESFLFDFYNHKNPYTIAYKNYIDSRYKNASSVSELLKIRPDWSEKVLFQKHRELYHNDNFELGYIPQSIGNIDNLQQITNYLRSFFDYGFKIDKKIDDLIVNNKVFKFKNFIDGKSDKNVFLIETPNAEKFIIKMGSLEQKGLNLPFAIGTCSIIDTYLTQNNCRNSAPIRYYNHENNIAIYDYIEHKHADKMNSLGEFTDNMPDFEDLGLKHNDTVGNNNYFVLDKDQNAMKNTYDFKYGVEHNEYVSVDNDHVNYTQNLNPKIEGYHIFLPNAMQMFF